jgi:transcription elongation factor Elf1
MRFIVFQCRKCGHLLYVENTDDLARMLRKISNADCPNCGEEPEGNWVLVGLRRDYEE